MANTFELIASSTVGSGGVSAITFSSIPSTYTDLCLKVSARADASTVAMIATFNGSTSGYSNKRLYGTGSSVASDSYLTTGIICVLCNDSTYTANTFANGEMYIPNYAGSTYKSASLDGVSENNATTAYAMLTAGLWSNTAAITSITLTPTSGNVVQYSTAYLYGVKNA
jgi:hypothetical protein